MDCSWVAWWGSAVLVFRAGALAQEDYSKVEIKSTIVAGPIHMLEGLGGNIGVSAGPDGLLIVDDQFGAPTSSREIAAATTQALSQLCASGSPLHHLSERSGIYHMTAGGETNWHAFAEAILREVVCCKVMPSWAAAATNQRPLIARRVVAIRTDEYPTPARRPAYSVLSNARLAAVFGTRLPDWNIQLHSHFSEL